MNIQIPEHLNLCGESLCDFVNLLPTPAHVKEIKTGKYILTNQSNLEIYGFTHSKELLGKSIDDLDGFMQPFWGVHFAKIVKELDHDTITRKRFMVDNNRIILTSKGFVHIQNMTKVPVIGDAAKAVAILTFSQTITSQIDILDLYHIYKKIYGNKKKAIHYFIEYLQLSTVFSSEPTDAEINVLLCMRHNSSQKAAANLLHTQTKTIEAHVRNIRSKLNHMHFSDLLTLLRHQANKKEPHANIHFK